MSPWEETPLALSIHSLSLLSLSITVFSLFFLSLCVCHLAFAPRSHDSNKSPDSSFAHINKFIDIFAFLFSFRYLELFLPDFRCLELDCIFPTLISSFFELRKLSTDQSLNFQSKKKSLNFEFFWILEMIDFVIFITITVIN